MTAPKGTFLEVRPRSGLGSKGVIMVNAPGTIDRDYAGEVCVPLTYLFAGGYTDRRRGPDRSDPGGRGPPGPVRARDGSAPRVPVGGGFGSTGR